ncbi:peptidase M2 family protein [Altererythrobacter xixiisoli]|uniref:Peptidase M2 family protein n=1 Tax=Croceibacterium xixiisoli TaxID=1476466 RepID=A0A6I4TUZ2_9SPHN|nr:M2 family metallopeptidase [Croceibacterium xixiisoli]MXO99049.1 peptidase M2 family protein [Croceibacterium xixiisoli]
MKSLASVALFALAAGLGAPAMAQQSTPTAATPASAAAAFPMTPQGAADFIAAAEKDFADFSVEAARVSWINSTYITEDTDAVMAVYGARATEKSVQYALDAARYAQVQGLDPEVERKLTMLRTGIVLPAPTTPGAAAELSTISTNLQSDYGKGRGTLNGQPVNGSDIEAEMAVLTHTPAEFAEMWTSWHDNVGAPMKDDYARMVTIANEGARELGFADAGAMWRSNYDMDADEFAGMTEKLWQELQPLYLSLHTYVRSRLNEKYGESVQPAAGPIRADLLGNMWAQQWGNIYPLVAPQGAGDIGYDLTALIEAKGMSEIDMVRAGEGFFSSLGFEPLPETFWQRSQFVKPADREVICHASAWDIDNLDDLRIKMCIKKNADDFVTIHHELGHNYYQRAYNGQDFLHLNGANDGFHEAIGDMIALSITPEYLVQIGMLDRAAVPGPEKDIGLLLQQALDKVAFLPFGLLVDKWRWGVFDGTITPDNYNQAWVDLKREYQGITPPVDRPADAFDPGAKYHIPGNTPYMRYFLAGILQFQFYKAACDQAGWTGPLHRCSFYDNKEVGERLNAMLEMGASKPWPDALEAFTGSREISGAALVEYFAPLKQWLDQQNAGKPSGW